MHLQGKKKKKKGGEGRGGEKNVFQASGRHFKLNSPKTNNHKTQLYSQWKPLSTLPHL